MTNAELLNLIYTRIGGERKSGVLKPVLLSYLPDALSSACRLIATHKPTGHQKLYKDFVVSSFTDSNDGTIEFTIPDLIIEDQTFHKVTVVINAVSTDAYSVQAFKALKLAESHGLIYYMVDNDKVILKIDDAVTVAGDITDVTVRHYHYSTLTDYPDELVDILIEEILKRIALNNFVDTTIPAPKKKR